jgi:hypothetical protein
MLGVARASFGAANIVTAPDTEGGDAGAVWPDGGLERLGVPDDHQDNSPGFAPVLDTCDIGEETEMIFAFQLCDFFSVHRYFVVEIPVAVPVACPTLGEAPVCPAPFTTVCCPALFGLDSREAGPPF